MSVSVLIEAKAMNTSIQIHLVVLGIKVRTQFVCATRKGESEKTHSLGSYQGASLGE